jgi:RHS repeat-associated protein
MADIKDSSKYVCVGQRVWFDGSASADQDEGGYKINEYKWDFEYGASDIVQDDPNASCVFNRAGTYIVRLRVKDDEGWWSNWDSCTVYVVKVAALEPDKGAEIDNNDPNRTFIVCVGEGTTTVTASPYPNVGESDLPDCWSLTGGNGSGKLTRTVDCNSLDSTLITAQCNLSERRTLIVVSPDDDNDSMPDYWEVHYDLDPNNPSDAGNHDDNDDLTNLQEYQNGTNPIDSDSDSDGMDDSWELDEAFDPLDATDASQDFDNDEYSNVCEYLHGTEPDDPNSIPTTNITIVVPDDVDSIQSAIDASIDGDMIEVRQGTFYETIDFKGNSVTLQSTDPNDWDVVAATIIDANDMAAAVTFEGTEDPNCLLKGFTITGGNYGSTLDSGLVGFWKLDGDPNDSSGNGRDGTLHSNPQWDPNGYIGGALDFDGTDDYVEIIGFKGVTHKHARTCAAWIKTDTGGDIISWGEDENDINIWLFYVSDNKLRVVTWPGDIIGSIVVNTGDWVHVAAVLEDVATPTTNNIKLYINGQLDENAIVTETADINTGSNMNVKIGVLMETYPRYFNGLIDDVWIYDRALSATEIRRLYGSGGGIAGNGTQAGISKCVITENTASHDGGGAKDLAGSITDCFIYDNSAGSYGGGLSNCSGIIKNSVIADNTASDFSGGLDYCGTIVNCTVVGNTAASGGGLVDCDSITNCIIWDNGDDLLGCSATYSCIEDGDSGEGNISTNPSFVNYSNPAGSDGIFGTLDDGLRIKTGGCVDSANGNIEPSADILTLGHIDISSVSNTGIGDPNYVDMGAYECYYQQDADNDKMADDWELLYDLDPTDPCDAGYDTDSDGLTNLEEYNAQTDPTDDNTDDDTFKDGFEVDNGLDPLVNSEGECVTVYEYDSAGAVTLQRDIEVRDGSAYMTEAHTVYDVLGRQTTQRRLAYPGVGTSRGPDNDDDRITIYRYDVAGNLKKTAQYKDSGGSDPNIITENFYDGLDRVTKVKDGEEGETDYTYYAGGRLETTQDPNSAVTTNYYDNAGRLEKVVDAEGHYRKMFYDSLGRPIREISYDCASTPDNENDDYPLMQRRSQYDGMGHVIRQAVLADANSPADYAADPNSDMVTDFEYDGWDGSYPGMMVSRTIYYGAAPAKLATTRYKYDELGRLKKTTDPAGNQTILIYDSMGRVTQRQQIDDDPLGSNDITVTACFEYDNLGRLKKQIAKLDVSDEDTWQVTRYRYALGNRIEETRPNGVIVTNEYNVFGQKTKMVADAATGGLKQTTEWGFDRVGRQTSIAGYTDNGDKDTKQTTTYTFDDLSRVTKTTYPDTKTIEYAYNSTGRVTKRTDQRNIVTYYDYDRVYNLAEKKATVSGTTSTETFSYDGLARMLSATKVEGAGTISESKFAYNAIGKITDANETIFDASSKTIEYAYDLAGFRTQAVLDHGSSSVTNIVPDWAGRVSEIKASVITIATYKYIGSRVARRSYPIPDVTYEPTYDNFGRITSADYGDSIVKFDYTYVENENNIATKLFDHRSGDPYNEYAYDDIDRLEQADYLKGELTEDEVFTMDDLGNRTEVNLRNGSDETYVVDDDTNRYTSIGGNNLTYDDAGNLTTDKDGYKYSYDYENRIIEIKDSSNNDVAEFAYDALGRRIKKYDAVAGQTTYYYYNDKWQVFAEFDGDDDVQRRYVYGNYIDEVLFSPGVGGSYYYLHDHLYSPVTLVNGSGTVIERYEYDAYGNCNVLESDFTADADGISDCNNPYFFTGRRLDVLDNGSLKVMYYRNRYFDTYAGRFLTHDPLEYVDGMNLYEYVRSNPTCRYDPSGNFSLPWPLKWFIHIGVDIDWGARHHYYWGTVDSWISWELDKKFDPETECTRKRLGWFQIEYGPFHETSDEVGLWSPRYSTGIFGWGGTYRERIRTYYGNARIWEYTCECVSGSMITWVRRLIGNTSEIRYKEITEKQKLETYYGPPVTYSKPKVGERKR